ncbi:type II secretion system protein N [Brevundimonas sp.]|uniref:type II secretion system protein N n=1 Tax=Brevundimonas sp. TaxID=1871086 RepID=UPI002D779AFC|nr:type II secretion system protein N [Brevundimonas sp.]
MIGAIRNWSMGVREALSARPDRVRAAVEATLALVLVVQVGRLVWIAVEPTRASPAPAASTRPATPVDYSVFQRFDAFFRTGGQSSLAEDTAGGSSQMRLYGLRSDGAGGGSAIIGLADGRQLSVAVGETIEPGLILQSVGSDHVVLARGDSLSRLIFSDLPVGAAPPPPPPPVPQTVTPTPTPASAAAPAPVDPARLMAEASLRPRMQGLRINGFTVSSKGDGAALAAAGLRSGDVVLAVNGQALDRLDRVAALRTQLSSSASAEIRFERDGAVQTTTIRTGR